MKRPPATHTKHDTAILTDHHIPPPSSPLLLINCCVWMIPTGWLLCHFCVTASAASTSSSTAGTTWVVVMPARGRRRGKNPPKRPRPLRPRPRRHLAFACGIGKLLPSRLPRTSLQQQPRRRPATSFKTAGPRWHVSLAQPPPRSTSERGMTDNKQKSTMRFPSALPRHKGDVRLF